MLFFGVVVRAPGPQRGQTDVFCGEPDQLFCNIQAEPTAPGRSVEPIADLALALGNVEDVAGADQTAVQGNR